MTEHVPRKSRRTAACLMAGGFLLTSCGASGNTIQAPDSFTAAYMDGSFIPEGVNVRYSPGVVNGHSDGMQNKCFTANKDISIKPTDVRLTEGDANGPWLGIPVASLPDSMQQACRDDKDGMVWVAQKLIIGTLSFDR